MSEGKVTVVQVSPGEALAAQLGARAVAAACEALRLGGYRPTPEQLKRIARELTAEALAAGLALAELVAAGSIPAPGDDDLDEAADRSGAAKVLALLGPPALVN